MIRHRPSSASSPPMSAPGSTGCMSASSVAAVPRNVRPGGGTRRSTSVQPGCYRLGVSSPTVATRLRRNGSSGWKILSACSVAAASATAHGSVQRDSTPRVPSEKFARSCCENPPRRLDWPRISHRGNEYMTGQVTRPAKRFRQTVVRSFSPSQHRAEPEVFRHRGLREPG
ncbi:hypothetical protein D3C71_1719940 [compost metagenome]